MALPIFAYYMKALYADEQLGYNENALFDMPEAYNPCSYVDEALGENDIEEIYE